MNAVEFERVGAVAVITLARPERLNALGRAVLEGMADAFTAFRTDPSLRVAVLTGTGRAFCVGMDVKERLEGDSPGLGLPDISPRVDPFWPDRVLEKPVVTAVNGYAVGGGFYLAMLGDIIIAAADAQFEITEVHRGGLSGWEVGYLWGLPRAVRNELALGGRLNASRAAELGIVNEVAPAGDLLNRAMERADRLAQLSPRVARMNLELTRALDPVVPADLERRRIELQRVVAAHGDEIEGIASFVEKRPPTWGPELEDS